MEEEKRCHSQIYYIEVAVECDKCDNSETFSFYQKDINQDVIVSHAVEAGWKVDTKNACENCEEEFCPDKKGPGHIFICPDCVKKGN